MELAWSFGIKTVHPHIERQSEKGLEELKMPLFGLEKPFAGDKGQQLNLSPICFQSSFSEQL